MTTSDSRTLVFYRVFPKACQQAGLDATGGTPIRVGENAIFRLPAGVIVRVARSGQQDAAAKEVNVARWLEASGLPAVRALDISQPVVIDGHAATFWHELPEHRQGTPSEVATAIWSLHQLPTPTDFDLPQLRPFVRLAERIDGATVISDDDRAWLNGQLDLLQARYSELPDGLAPAVIHGDAWAGNVVHTQTGEIAFLDLERFSIGPPEWDLVSTAVKFASYGHIDASQYTEFATSYDHDVMQWPGFATLRDIRELRVTCYATQRASEQPEHIPEAQKRIDCLRGRRGPRPWTDWRPLT